MISEINGLPDGEAIYVTGDEPGLPVYLAETPKTEILPLRDSTGEFTGHTANVLGRDTLKIIANDGKWADPKIDS